jgi:hypothetical protein
MKVRIWVHQDHLSDPRETTGYFDSEGNELVDKEEQAGHFTLTEAMHIIEASDYEGCKLNIAKLERIELDEEAIALEAGSVVLAGPNGSDRAELAFQTLAGFFGMRGNEIARLYDQNGQPAFIDWVNEKIKEYK